MTQKEQELQAEIDRLKGELKELYDARTHELYDQVDKKYQSEFTLYKEAAEKLNEAMTDVASNFLNITKIEEQAQLEMWAEQISNQMAEALKDYSQLKQK